MQTSLPFAQNDRLAEVVSRLTSYWPSELVQRDDALRYLVHAVVSQKAASSVGLAIFNRLMRLYPNWQKLRDADCSALERIFVGLPGASAKAEGIPALLREIEARRGILDLDFLSRMSTESGIRWLETLPLVSTSMAQAVLAFSSLKRMTLPVDRDTARPIRRLGLVSDGVPISALARQVTEQLPIGFSSDELTSLGMGLRRLSRQFCHRGRPACGECPLKDICPSANQSAQVLAFPGRKEDEGKNGTAG